MKNLILICFLIMSFNNLQAQERTIIATYKEAACNDAACECNACYYTFVSDNGEEMVFNSISAENPDYTLLFIEVDGLLETNTANVGKKFKIRYKDENCQCMGFSETGEEMGLDFPSKVMLFFVLN